MTLRTLFIRGWKIQVKFRCSWSVFYFDFSGTLKIDKHITLNNRLFDGHSTSSAKYCMHKGDSTCLYESTPLCSKLTCWVSRQCANSHISHKESVSPHLFALFEFEPIGLCPNFKMSLAWRSNWKCKFWSFVCLDIGWNQWLPPFIVITCNLFAAEVMFSRTNQQKFKVIH